MSSPHPPSTASKTHLSAAITNFYDLRAATYDTEPDRFHISLAADFISLASPFLLSSPLKILDLCCGTGLVSFAARSYYGSEVTIHGVDQSIVSLRIAQEKAVNAGDERMLFLEGSVTDLADLNLERGSYDLITCCSALVLLLEDLHTTIQDWVTYLRPGGVLVFDVPAPGTQIVGTLANKAIKKRGALGFRRGEIEEEGTVRELIDSAGLDCKTVVRTRVYKTETFGVNEADGKWEGLMRHQIFNVGALSEDQREDAKREFLEGIERAAGDDGVVRDEVSLLVGIAVKSG